jgi:integrase
MTKPRRRRRAGEGTISAYQTKAGRRFLIKYKNPHEGEEPEWIVRRGFLTYEAADDFLGDVDYEIRKGVHVVPSKKTTGKWLDDWLEGLRLAPSTMASYRKNVRLHVTPHIGQVPLDKLTGTDITRVYRKLEAGGRQDHKAGSPLSARTIRYCHTILKAALREAVNQGLIAVNPADKTQPPAAKEAKAPEGEQLIEGSTKTGKGRSVDLHPRTVAALRSWRVARAGLDLRLARDDALIFGDLEGGYLNPDRFSRRFTRSLTLARKELGADVLIANRRDACGP